MTRPFGNLESAKVLVIGHDPRLQSSLTQASYALFADYFFKPVPERPSERAKYDLASNLFQYIAWLTNMRYLASDIYVTNLCNDLLPRSIKGKTIYIPQAQAERGIANLRSTLLAGRFEVIFAMSLQVNYWIQKLGFSSADESFVSLAEPRAHGMSKGFYEPVGRSPFLRICGRQFDAEGTTLFPVLHVKQFPLKGPIKRHYLPLLNYVINAMK